MPKNGERRAKPLADNEIRSRFIELRQRVGSPSEVARLLETDAATLGGWEKGRRAIPQWARERVARAAGETLAYFLPEARRETERAEKLIAAKWFRLMADQLTEEATSPLRATEVDDLRAVGAREVADESEAGSPSAPGAESGRPGKGKPPGRRRAGGRPR